MRILLFILFCSQMALGQTVVDPSGFPSENNPTNSNFEFYSRKQGVNVKASFDAVRKGMLAVVNLTPIGYTPASSGNASNKGEIVTTASGDVWYIDGSGKAKKLSSQTLAALPVYTSDEDAAANCYGVGKLYQLASGNKYGMPRGSVRVQVFGTTIPGGCP